MADQPIERNIWAGSDDEREGLTAGGHVGKVEFESHGKIDVIYSPSSSPPTMPDILMVLYFLVV